MYVKTLKRTIFYIFFSLLLFVVVVDVAKNECFALEKPTSQSIEQIIGILARTFCVYYKCEKFRFLFSFLSLCTFPLWTMVWIVFAFVFPTHKRLVFVLVSHSLVASSWACTLTHVHTKRFDRMRHGLRDGEHESRCQVYVLVFVALDHKVPVLLCEHIEHTKAVSTLQCAYACVSFFPLRFVLDTKHTFDGCGVKNDTVTLFVCLNNSGFTVVLNHLNAITSNVRQTSKQQKSRKKQLNVFTPYIAYGALTDVCTERYIRIDREYSESESTTKQQIWPYYRYYNKLLVDFVVFGGMCDDGFVCVYVTMLHLGLTWTYTHTHARTHSLTHMHTTEPRENERLWEVLWNEFRIKTIRPK